MTQKYDTHLGRKVIFIADTVVRCVDCAFYDVDCSNVPCTINVRSDRLTGYFVDYVETETQPTKHVHHDMIVAWAADPSQIVEVSPDGLKWWEISEPSWTTDGFYRFKPKPVIKVQFLKVHATDDEDVGISFSGEANANLKLTFVDDVLTKSEVLMNDKTRNAILH